MTEIKSAGEEGLAGILNKEQPAACWSPVNRQLQRAEHCLLMVVV